MNTSTETLELAGELTEIHEQMTELVRMAERLLRQAPDLTYRRAHGYWLAQITMALSDDHDYLGRGTITMQDTIRELENDGLVGDEEE